MRLFVVLYCRLLHSVQIHKRQQDKNELQVLHTFRSLHQLERDHLLMLNVLVDHLVEKIYRKVWINWISIARIQ